ncbi:MAG TPA: glucosamine-6-phosphate deaminase [Bacteroidales bacterium]|nr:glucosamine-6-phosphate deaminase [Bacteroidales bacterium]
MEIIVYSDHSTLSLETAARIARIVRQKPDALLCFPAGETSLATFAELVRMSDRGEVDFTKCSFVGLDEWVHLKEKQEENCFHFLQKHLFGPLSITSDQICFFNGEASDLEYECKKTDDYIRSHGSIDMMLLGMGMNGHLGLNEPGTSFDLYSHVIGLDKVTMSVGQKYFSENIKLTHGITLGMKHIRETGTVILQVSGARKKSIVANLLSSEVSTQLPASFLKLLPQAYLLLDREAAS